MREPICFVCAPHFHFARPLAERLHVNSAIPSEGDRAIPLDGWRVPSPDELAMLIAAGEPSQAVALINIPDRLRGKWWDLAAEQTTDSQAGGEAFRGFAGQVLEFLQYKGLPLPPACTFELVIHAPGLVAPGGKPLGAINLGDEESALVFWAPSSHALVKLALGPGEGFWLGATDLEIWYDTRGRREVDVQLVMSVGK